MALRKEPLGAWSLKTTCLSSSLHRLTLMLFDPLKYRGKAVQPCLATIFTEKVRCVVIEKLESYK